MMVWLSVWHQLDKFAGLWCAEQSCVVQSCDVQLCGVQLCGVAW